MLQIWSLIYVFVVTIQVTETNYTFWTFIPNISITIAVSWGDIDIPVVVNTSSWVPGPYDNRDPSQAMEEGSVIDNYTVGVWEIPICMGNGLSP